MGNNHSKKSNGVDIAAAKDLSISDRFKIYEKSSLRVQKEAGQPRVLFISLFHLWRDWCNIPIDILYSSLCVFNCNRETIFNNVVNSGNNSDDTFEYNPFNYSFEDLLEIDSEFIEFLTLKEAQNRVLWIKRSHQQTTIPNRLFKYDCRLDKISFWLSKQSDPMRSQQKYNPLITDYHWWANKIDVTLRMYCDGGYPTTNAAQVYKYAKWDVLATQLEHCTDLYTIQAELQLLGRSFQAFSEILSQSNPTLIVMTVFDEKRWNVKSRFWSAAQHLDWYWNGTQIKSIDGHSSSDDAQSQPMRPATANNNGLLSLFNQASAKSASATVSSSSSTASSILSIVNHDSNSLFIGNTTTDTSMRIVGEWCNRLRLDSNRYLLKRENISELVSLRMPITVLEKIDHEHFSIILY